MSNLTVTVPAQGQAALAWNFDPGTGAAIVKWRKAGATVWSQYVPPTATKITLTGLDPTVTYEAEVVLLPVGGTLSTQFKPVVPPPPPPVPTFLKGMTFNLAGWGLSGMPSCAAQLGDLGVNWVRVDLDWSDVEKSPGKYDWSAFDALAAAASQCGLKLLPVLGYAPGWTSTSDTAAYAAFVAAAVKRYGPGTSANCPWFELWNEPSVPKAWGGPADPTAYGKLARAGAQAAKQANAAVKLAVYGAYDDSPQSNGPDAWCTTWIDGIFAAAPDLAKFVDAIASHPYSGDPSLPLADPVNGWKDANGEWAFARVDQIRKKFQAHGAALPMLITELGWSTYAVTPVQQATYYTNLRAEISKRPWITGLFPFTLREWGNNSNDQSQYGLLSYPSWSPKPALATLRATFASIP